MIDTTVLSKPFVMIYLNLELQSLIYNDLLSEHDYNILSEIGDKIIEIMPGGKIANLYKEKYHNSDKFWTRESIKNDIWSHTDYDTQYEVTHFKKSFYADLSVDEEVKKYIEVFKPLVDKLHKQHLKNLKIISEAMNA